MPPQAVSLGIFIIEEAIKESPAIYAELQRLFTKSDPTPADWAELRAKVAEKHYKDFVPATAIVP